MIRVLVAERAPMIGAALAALLSREPDIEVVGELASMGDIVEVTLQETPDVVLIDVDEGTQEAYDLAEELRRVAPQSHTVLLTGSHNPEAIQRAVTTCGYGVISKETSAADVVDALRRIVAGDRFVDPVILAASRRVRENPLSPRELEVLRLAATGLPVVEIASSLSLSPGTVNNYLSAINVKLGARTRVDAIRIAHEAGWL